MIEFHWAYAIPAERKYKAWQGRFYKAHFFNGSRFKGSSSSFNKIWLNCLSVAKRGVTHDSSQATKFEDLKKMVVTDSRTAEKYTSSVIT